MGLQSIYLELKGSVKMKKGKEFIFPENVDKDYGIWKDYTLKDFGYMALTGGLGLLFIILPPYNLILVLTKIVIVEKPKTTDRLYQKVCSRLILCRATECL